MTGNKPQRSTALAGIWQVSFGAIRKANARRISGLVHSRYLKSRRACLVDFLWGRAFVCVRFNQCSTRRPFPNAQLDATTRFLCY